MTSNVTVYLDDIVMAEITEYVETIEATIHVTPAIHVHEDWEVIEDSVTVTGAVSAGETVVIPDATVTVTPSISDIYNLAVIIEAGITVTPSCAAATAWHETLAGTVHVYPIIPGSTLMPGTIWSDSVTGEESIVSGKVSMSVEDKMYRGTFVFVGDKKANFEHFEFKMPDYLAVENTVLLGFFPSSASTYEAANDKSTLTAYSQAWYLTMQYLSDADKVLLSAADAATQVIWRLSFSNGVGWLHEGDILHGDTSGNEGRILEIHGYYTGYVLLENLTGTMPDGVHYFSASESLSVETVNKCYSDGYALNQGSDPAVLITPEEWIRRVLGGDNWNTITGIMPYNIVPVAGWAAMGKSFAWDEKTTKMKAIEEVCEYLNYLFYVKWKDIAGTMTPCAYFVPLAMYWNYLDLPATVNIQKTDPFVVSGVTYGQKGDLKYTKITVKCVGWDGDWYTATRYYMDTWVEFPIEHVEICPYADSQALADARADILEAYYMTPLKTWSVTLLKRSDLELYQQVTFTGFGTEIPTDAMRIIGIEHEYAEGGTVNTTSIECITEAEFNGAITTRKIFHHTIAETEIIAQSVVDKAGTNETATVVSVSVDGTVVTRTDSGNIRLARDGLL